MLENTREFNVPYLSLIKQLPKIITTEDNNDTPAHDKEILFDNIFYHIIPYIIATEKELDRYNTLISYDLFISYLSWYDTETKVKFLSSALRNQKKPTRIHKSLKQIYTIFYSEYKQYHTLITNSSLNNITYTATFHDIAKRFQAHYSQLMVTYFIVQNLIRLSSQRTLYGIRNAKELTQITSDSNPNHTLYTKRAIKTAWDNHGYSAVLIFGFVHNLLNKKGWNELCDVPKFIPEEQYNAIKTKLSSDEFKEAFINYDNYNEDAENILRLAQYAENIICNQKNSQSSSAYSGIRLNKMLTKKINLTPLTLSFNKISSDESRYLYKSYIPQTNVTHP